MCLRIPVAFPISEVCHICNVSSIRPGGSQHALSQIEVEVGSCFFSVEEFFGVCCRAFQWDLVVVGYPEVPVRGVIFQHQVNTKPVAHSNRLVPQPFIRDTAPSRGPEPEILVFPLITAGPRLFALSEVPMACLAVP